MSTIKKYSSGSRTDWQRLRRMADSDIDFAEIPELNKTFWDNAEVGIIANKRLLSLRLDADIIDWFKGQGPRYQTRINAVLRAYMLSQRT